MLSGINFYRMGGAVIAVLGIIALVVFGVRQYGNARVVAQELSNTQEAVQEAVQRRDERVQRDVSTKAERASTGRKTASVVKRTEDALANLKPESRTGVLLSPDERGVWNDLIRDANRSIDAS